MPQLIPQQTTEQSNEYDTLSVQEHKRFTALESQIQDNLFGYRQVSAALLEIHDQRLYRAKYRSFESYLKSRWGTLHGDISRMQAWRMIEHERTLQAFEAESVTHALQITVPQSLRQSEALASLPAQDRPAAFGLAQEVTGKEQPSGREIGEVVAAIQPTRLDFVDTDPEPQTPVEDPAWVDARSAPYDGIANLPNPNAPRSTEPRRCENIEFDSRRLSFQLIVPTRNGIQKWYGSISRRQLEKVNLYHRPDPQDALEIGESFDGTDDLPDDTDGGVRALVARERQRVAKITGNTLPITVPKTPPEEEEPLPEPFWKGPANHEMGDETLGRFFAVEDCPQ